MQALSTLRLTIELVPATCWYSNVRSNVTAKTWCRLQQQHFARAKHRCQICQGRGPAHPVELHEIWQYDDATATQRLTGLIALCPDCHEVKHIGYAIRHGRLPQALAHLVQVNHLTVADAEVQIREAFTLHAGRSKRTWRLDLSILSRQFGVVLDTEGRERGLVHG
ncbi:MAG: HNH endonuclease [Rhodanobacter sp.]